MTGRVVVLTDEGGGTSEESVGSGRDDDALSLTLLAGRATVERRGSARSVRRDGARWEDAREGLVTELLADGERLAGEGGLVHGNLDGLGETAVGGADITVLERDEVTRDEASRLGRSRSGHERRQRGR